MNHQTTTHSLNGSMSALLTQPAIPSTPRSVTAHPAIWMMCPAKGSSQATSRMLALSCCTQKQAARFVAISDS